MLIENGRLSLGRRNSASEGCREETGGKVLFDMLYMQIEVCFVPIVYISMVYRFKKHLMLASGISINVI